MKKTILFILLWETAFSLLAQGWTNADGRRIVSEQPDCTCFVFKSEEPKCVNCSDIFAEVQKEYEIKRSGMTAIPMQKIGMNVAFNEYGTYIDHYLMDNETVSTELQEIIAHHITKMISTPKIENGIPLAFWLELSFEIQ